MSKIYKDYKIYCCFALNRLVTELNIDIYQEGLEEKLDAILSERKASLSKDDIMHEIRSNHYMTDKVIEKLLEDGLIEVKREEKRYSITITKKGILHLRKFNEFYAHMYEEQIKDHYKYKGLPLWVK